jgi:hypothetical protein
VARERVFSASMKDLPCDVSGASALRGAAFLPV